MAKKMRGGDAVQAAGVTREDLQKAIAEIIRQKDHASEYAGLAGKATQNAVERHGLDKKALTFVTSLKRMEDGKRQATLRAVVEYAHKMDFFAQLDAFDDLLGTLREILDVADENTTSARGADTPADIGAMIN